jgi:hypothetical protein
MSIITSPKTTKIEERFEFGVGKERQVTMPLKKRLVPARAYETQKRLRTCVAAAKMYHRHSILIQASRG